MAVIRRLFEECADFFRLIHGDPVAEAEQIFDDLPPGKRPEDKLVFGICVSGGNDRLVGLVELLRDYPMQHDWCLGLLVLAPAYRGRGLGAATVAAISRFVSLSTARTLQMVVQEQNPAALRFWQRHGFVIRDWTSQAAAHGTNQVARLVLALPTAPDAPSGSPAPAG